MRVRDYRGPLGVLAAGAIGVSLLCSVSTMAMSDLNSQTLITVAPLDIVGLAVANLNTAVALTEQAVTQFVPTATSTAIPTHTASLTPVPSDTPTLVPSPTRPGPTRTRRPRNDSSGAAPTSRPIRTAAPPTGTSVPPTRTSPPPTNTPLPPPPTDVPPTDIPPTDIPPTDVPPTNIPPTDVPPTDVPPTDPPPTDPPPPTEPPVQNPSAGEAVPTP